ncbi:LysR family transcriptional regulator [Microvirga pudoricolor]|uniref:LysR family transcriptional regulator n=1 Tax=Microvirga pudoricolor TaxID=2778729 RepID=UPI0019514585|nr:LysR family transcriptional regulator [Microvirga pudoricolor]MBM6595219.1 LysR family transcriptional regulator [Microvirga pudoricolor]
MARTGLTEYEAVMAVARHRSFRAAATELGLSTTALSQTVAALEARLGVRLFNRTTRSVSLTAAGEGFIERLAPAVAAIREAEEAVNSHRDTPVGTLRLNTSVGAARQILQPIVFAYLRRYPQMKVDIVTEGRLVDIVADGFDAGIRLLEAVPQDMIAVAFGPDQRLVVVGSPDYLAQNPAPQAPADLLAHSCIRSRLPSGSIWRWEFERRGEEVTVDVQGPLTLDEAHLMQDAARAGIGLAYLSEWNVAEDLKSGRLVRVLDEWTPSFQGLCLYYPGRRHVPAGLRAFIGLIKAVRERSA